MQNLTEKLDMLNAINYQIAELSRTKESLEAEVSKELHTVEDGSKTYIQDKYKVTITTGYIYKVDAEEYEVMKSKLREEFNPIRIKTSYDVNKKIIETVEKYGSSDDVFLLQKFITKKPKKLHVKLAAAV